MLLRRARQAPLLATALSSGRGASLLLMLRRLATSNFHAAPDQPGGSWGAGTRTGEGSAAAGPDDAPSTSGQAQPESAFLRSLTDLTSPSASYPLARSFRRKVVAHLGQTNSGACVPTNNRVAAAGGRQVCHACEPPLLV